MNVHLQRASLYLGQERYSEALTELAQALAEDPNDARVHALSAICLSETGEYKQADEAAKNAIGLAPEEPFVYDAASRVSLKRDDFRAAKSFALKSIELDPYDCDYFEQLSLVYLATSDWKKALEAAEQGLDLDPESVGCQNVRSLALNRLGRHDEAGDTIRETLQQAPENAFSHANMGWELLFGGDPKEALSHFKEALRLEPEMEYARQGVVEAMKGRFFLYRIFLTWLLFCQKLKGRYLMAIVFGGYLGFRLCISLMESYPVLKPVLIPFVIAYISFAIMTWISQPLFNLVLRTSPFGRMVLSDEETRTSTWVGIILVMAIGFVATYFATGNFSYVAAALASALSIPAISTYYSSTEGWPRALHGLLIFYLLGLWFVLVGCMIGGIFSSDAIAIVLNKIGDVAALPYLYSAFASQFATSFLTMARPQKGTELGRWTRIGGGSVLGIFFTGVAVAIVFAIANASSISEEMLLDSNKEFIEKLVNREYSEVEDTEWKNESLVQAYTKQFEDSGFPFVADIQVTDSGVLITRCFISDSKKLLATLAEIDAVEKIRIKVYGINEDGVPVGVTSWADTDEADIMLFPEHWKLRYGLESDVEQLIEEAGKDVANLELKTWDRESLLVLQKRLLFEQTQHVLVSQQLLDYEEAKEKRELDSELAIDMCENVFLLQHPEFRDKMDEVFIINEHLSNGPFKIAKKLLDRGVKVDIQGGPLRRLITYTSSIGLVKDPDEVKRLAKDFFDTTDQFVFHSELKDPVSSDVYVLVESE